MTNQINGAPWGPGNYRYAREAPAVPTELDPEAAVSQLRAVLAHEVQRRRIFQARAERQTAMLQELQRPLQEVTNP